ncbi:hypothetical protein ACWD6P_21920 [Streptomyces sp. NPDC002446]
MPTNSTPQPASTGRAGGCCCLLLTFLPVAWLLATPFLPEQVAWFPISLGAVVWNGTDGQSGISHWFG